MTPISIGETLSGTWDSGTVSTSTRLKRAYVKYFTFSVDTNISLTISLSSNSADPMLYLLSSDGNKITENDDASERTYSSQIEKTLSPGNYTIEAALYDPGMMSSFEISLSSEESAITATIDVTISNLVHKGAVKRTQADEYVEISNSGNSPANISGWKITSAGTSKQLFTFPEGTILEGGKSFRVYTNEIHPETGGFSFGNKTAIWNDAGDEAKLFDCDRKQCFHFSLWKNTIYT